MFGGIKMEDRITLNAHDLEEIRRKGNEKINNSLKDIQADIHRELANGVRQERDELETKVAKLENFIEHGVYANDIGKTQKMLLLEQLRAMTTYQVILEIRLHLMAANHAVD